MRPSSITDNTKVIIESLDRNPMEFVSDLDNNVTFVSWFRRYEELLLIDGAKLDDAARVRLLLRNLRTANKKYKKFIISKHPQNYIFNQFKRLMFANKKKCIVYINDSKVKLQFNCFRCHYY